RAFDRVAFREGVAAGEQALQALAHLPEDGHTRRLAIECRLALALLLMQVREHGRWPDLLGEAEARARALDDRALLGRVLAQKAGQTLWGDHEGAIAAGQKALELAAVLGDRALQVQASNCLGLVYYTLGDFGRAAALSRRHVEAADRESDISVDWRVRSQAFLAQTLGMLGAFTEGRRHGEEALRLATLEGRGLTPIAIHNSLGV